MTAANDRPANPGGPIPGLDGIRAIAVLLVFFAHSELESFVPGGLGVTIFFVLSGYLITTLMRIEHSRGGRLAGGGECRSLCPVRAAQFREDVVHVPRGSRRLDHELRCDLFIRPTSRYQLEDLCLTRG